MLKKLISRKGQNAVQNVYIYPAFFALVFIIIQLGLVYNANNVAHAAAEAAYTATRLEGGTEAHGRTAANEVLAGQGAFFGSGSVSLTRTPTQVRVTVQGHAPSLVPFWDGPSINQEVSGPTERWVN